MEGAARRPTLSPKADLGVSLWVLYASQGRVLPAAWVARAVGVSPTTMGAALRRAGFDYGAARGRRPGQGWNWGALAAPSSMAPMDETYMISNGEILDFSGETDEQRAQCAALAEQLPEGETGLDFDGAMRLVDEGLAVGRRANCRRVIFLVKGREGRWQGEHSKRGHCAPQAPYEPTDEDQAARDWHIDVVPLRFAQ